MIKGKREMKDIILCLISILIIAGWLLGSVTQTFAETKQYKLVLQVSKVELLPVGDTVEHVLGIAESRGLMFVDGEVAVYTGWSVTDTIKGAGVTRGYAKEVYADGSTTIRTTQFDRVIAPDGKTILLENGKGEFIRGTGRFEGIKGTGTGTAKYLPVEEGEAGPKGIGEYTMTYTLPSK